MDLIHNYCDESLRVDRRRHRRRNNNESSRVEKEEKKNAHGMIQGYNVRQPGTDLGLSTIKIK